jgi:predicted nucleic acid-binding protein
MKGSVYVESSVVSYLRSRTSRDLVLAARQQETRDWWENERQGFEVYVSELVLREISDGDQEAAAERLESLRDVPNLDLNDECYSLSKALLDSGAIPKKYPEDALHIAVAAVHGIDYLLTWNFRHINNAVRRSQIEKAVRDYGFECPVICTPEELTEGEP